MPDPGQHFESGAPRQFQIEQNQKGQGITVAFRVIPFTFQVGNSCLAGRKDISWVAKSGVLEGVVKQLGIDRVVIRQEDGALLHFHKINGSFWAEMTGTR